MAYSCHETGNCVMSGPDGATAFARVTQLDPSYVGNGRKSDNGLTSTDHIWNTQGNCIKFPRSRTSWTGEIGWTRMIAAY